MGRGITKDAVVPKVLWCCYIYNVGKKREQMRSGLLCIVPCQICYHVEMSAMDEIK